MKAHKPHKSLQTFICDSSDRSTSCPRAWICCGRIALFIVFFSENSPGFFELRSNLASKAKSIDRKGIAWCDSVALGDSYYGQSSKLRRPVVWKVMPAAPVKPKGVCFKFWDWGKCDLGGRCKYEHVYKNNVVIPETNHIVGVSKKPELPGNVARCEDRKQGIVEPVVAGGSFADKNVCEQQHVASTEGILQDFRSCPDKLGSPCLSNPGNPGQNHHHQVNSASAMASGSHNQSVPNQHAPATDLQSVHSMRMGLHHVSVSSSCTESRPSNNPAPSPHEDMMKEKQVTSSLFISHVP